MKESTVLFHHQTNLNCSVLHLLKFNVSEKKTRKAVQKVVVQLKNQNRILWFLWVISENVTFENRTTTFFKFRKFNQN